MILIAVAALTVATQPVIAQEIAPILQERLTQATGPSVDSLVDVVVFLENDNSTNVISIEQNVNLTRSQKIQSVTSQLNSYLPRQASSVHQSLSVMSQASVERLWIVPAYTATVRLSEIERIAALDGVRLVTANIALDYTAPISVTDAPPQLSASVSDALQLLNVPALWAQGIKGAGRLVCSFDTGVERDHPALADKWRGNHEPLSTSWFSKVSPNDPPSDRSGHGTHTMGIMVGAAPSDSFGVAPEAEWITAGVVDQGRPLATTLSDLLEAFQWALNPDGDTTTTDDVPDVISNSWGIPKGLFTPCDQTFAEVIDAVEAAGIVTIFAAGNEGPDRSSLRYPADLATTPTSAFAVGAVDYDGNIASFSSRGPSSCNGEIKPEIVAPGVQIRSATKGGTYAYMQGTSQSAPFIAGLVALMRQYNPEATVAQIKYALIQAAVDRGIPGEDNDYGHGLVDASQLLQYLPAPGAIEVAFLGAVIEPLQTPQPGDTVSLTISLASPNSTVPQLSGRLSVAEGAGASILNSTSTFIFDANGTGQTATPFRLSFAPDLAHGQTVELSLEVLLPADSVLKTFAFEIVVGTVPEGIITSHQTGDISFSVSDFGQYGFGPGSIYNAGGEGFRYNGQDNVLFEAGIVVGRNELQLSSAIRDEQGQFRPSDFLASSELKDSDFGDGIQHTLAEYDDNYSEIPIPLGIVQDVMSFNQEEDVLILRFGLINQSVERLTNLHFGFLADFDLTDGDESLVYDEEARMLYQVGDGSHLVGLVPLMNVASFEGLINDGGKTGFSRTELFSMISDSQSHIDPAVQGDVMFMAHTEAFTIDPGAMIEVAFALVAGDDLLSLSSAAQRARELFDIATSIDPRQPHALPSSVDLHQNFPNPFNPTTTIGFTLMKAGQVSLDVFNTLGQQVASLHSGTLPAGSHNIEWRGTDATGNAVASGVYFYRIATDSEVRSRKMLLLK
jgi:subtilisin family serine protease